MSRSDFSKFFDMLKDYTKTVFDEKYQLNITTQYVKDKEGSVKTKLEKLKIDFMGDLFQEIYNSDAGTVVKKNLRRILIGGRTSVLGNYSAESKQITVDKEMGEVPMSQFVGLIIHELGHVFEEKDKSTSKMVEVEEYLKTEYGANLSIIDLFGIEFVKGIYHAIVDDVDNDLSEVEILTNYANERGSQFAKRFAFTVKNYQSLKENSEIPIQEDYGKEFISESYTVLKDTYNSRQSISTMTPEQKGKIIKIFGGYCALDAALRASS
ncbi:MAG: hypothetical protein GOU98_03840 [Candidatus Altiarchaeota archaeon]|nr:hypothetical protein [Candidatus Altiarchaeota archaeon]